LTAADFNGDDKLDLAVVNQFDDTISLLLGNGDGTFQTRVNYATGVLPTWVGTADFNGDGKLDLTTADADNVGGIVASILLGNGDGTFQPNVDYYNGKNSDQLAIGDFNGDGKLDLAAADGFSNTAFILVQGATTVTLLPDALSFGNQVVGTTSVAQTLTLTNTGTTALKVNSIAAAPNFSQTNTCGASLPVGASCTISVTFKPTGEGPLAGAVTVTGSAVGSPFTIPLSGTGVRSGPNVTLSATELSFSTQLLGTASTAQSVTLTNYGAKALRVTSIVASGDFSQTNTCGLTLPEGASCTISVTFKPTQVGTITGAVSITDNAPHSPQSVSLTGVGTEVELNPSSLYFTTKGEKQTTLTNVGSSALSISSIVITGSDVFSQTNTCGSEVAAGASCTITVTFTGRGEGLFSADVVVSDNGGASPQEVSLSAVRKKGCGKPCPQ